MKLLARSLTFIALSALTFSASAEGAQPGAHFILNGGLTAGGDQVATVHYTNGHSVNLHAGGLLQIGAGMLWQFDAPVALALTANYQVDSANGRNGDATFDRTPLELLAYYTGTPKWRFGGGVRFVQSPKYVGHVDGYADDTIDFDNSTGAVAEIGYGFNQHMWLNFRYVSEKYQPNRVSSGGVSSSGSNFASVNGSHAGINFTYQF